MSTDQAGSPVSGTQEGLTRVDFDDRGPRTRYEDIVEGESIGTVEWEITQQAVADFCEQFDDYDEWYSVRSPFGSTVAPPMMSYSPVRHLFSGKFNVRGLMYIYEIEFARPMLVGKVYTITGHISRKWVQNNREFVEYIATCHDDKSELVFSTKRAHVLDLITREHPRAGKGIDTGRVTGKAAEAQK